jgi:hypothetical protein
MRMKGRKAAMGFDADCPSAVWAKNAWRTEDIRVAPVRREFGKSAVF